MINISKIDAKRVAELLEYDPVSGSLTWKFRPVEEFSSLKSFRMRNAKFSGKKAGSLRRDGYIDVQVNQNGDSRKVLAHRLAWAIHYGIDADGEIDHINGNKSDNRIENLRLATRQENCRNKVMSKPNASGYKGVHKITSGSGYAAVIRLPEGLKHLGVFGTKEEAYECYKKASEVYHGEFGNIDDYGSRT